MIIKINDRWLEKEMIKAGYNIDELLKDNA